MFSSESPFWFVASFSIPLSIMFTFTPLKLQSCICHVSSEKAFAFPYILIVELVTVFFPNKWNAICPLCVELLAFCDITLPSRAVPPKEVEVVVPTFPAPPVFPATWTVTPEYVGAPFVKYIKTPVLSLLLAVLLTNKLFPNPWT